jgi:poly-gamma-glutamate capsule biosynthesis protein CapA/YwtB (metallophosphatase superfamily)
MIKRFSILIAILLLCISPANAQQVRLLFTGDVMQHGTQLKSAMDKRLNRYNFRPWFRFISPVIKKADIAIANLELTLAGPPYSGYPQFCAPDQLAAELKRAGFNVLITANNHSLDRGKKGIERTIRVLDSIDIHHTGTFTDQAERDSTYPFIIKKNGFRIALLNYTYGTNGIKVTAPNIVNYIDTQQIREDIEKAKLLHADPIIVTVHWGKEYKRLPNEEQKAIESFCYESGADLVIGSHPHVVQPIEKKKLQNGKEVLTAYSLGNYISNQRKRYTDGGIMLWIDLKKDETGNTVIDTAGYIPTWVLVKEIKSQKKFFIVPVSEIIDNNDTYDLDKEILEKMKLFLEDTRKHLKTSNIEVDELSLEYIDNLPPAEVTTKKYVYSILIGEKAESSFKDHIPVYLQKELITTPVGNNRFDYHIGNYISPIVAEGFLDLLKKKGFKQAGIIKTEITE